MDNNSTCRVCLDRLELSDGVNIFKTSIDDGTLLSTCFQLLFNFEVCNWRQIFFKNKYLINSKTFNKIVG